MTLDNVETRNATHPDTFEIPSRDAREALRPGDLVKVIGANKGGAERFWVKVTEARPSGRYVGALDNRLVCFALPAGALIAFGPEHVACIMTRDRAPGPVAA
ncbi:MAG: DUF2314 domain-containing protein [Sphingobacteriia bacterium]|nr:DUF2314 domain-containing protein [Sphingobacteriia bacterium]